MIALLSTLAFAVPVDTEPTDSPVETPVVAGVDRSGAPPVQAPALVDLSDLTVVELGPGLTLHHVRVPRIRKAQVSVSFWKGTVDMPDTSPQELELLSAMWGKATESMGPKELSSLVDSTGIDLSTWVGDHRSSVRVDVPVEDLSIGLDVLEDVVLRPVFPKRELTVVKEDIERWYATSPSDPATVANEALAYGSNPPDHPYGLRPDPDAYPGIKHKALPPLHEDVIGVGPVTILVVGDVAIEDVRADLTARFRTLGADAERSEALEVPTSDEERSIAIAMPSTEQVSIRMRLPAPAFATDDWQGMRMVYFALGGHFLSRFNKNLREEKGWTYGVRSWYAVGDKRGSLNIKVDVPAEHFAAAVTELKGEMKRIVEQGLTQDELDAGWRAAAKDYNDTRSGLDSAVGLYEHMLKQQLTLAEHKAHTEALGSVDLAEAQRVAGAVFTDAAPLWVAVGPEDALKAGVAELGWTPEWRTPEDAIQGRISGP